LSKPGGADTVGSRKRATGGSGDLHTSAIFRQDVAWVKEIRADLLPTFVVVLDITDVDQVTPGADAEKKILLSAAISFFTRG